MRTRFILILCFLSLISDNSFAQVPDLIVHFANAEDKPEKSTQLELDSWIKTHDAYKEKTILLRGHTDYAADEQFNKKLSERRSDAIEKALRLAGFNNITKQSYGEKWPSCNDNDENCMHQNRRVEIIVCDQADELFSLEQRMKCPQIFFFENSFGEVILGKAGTEIFIPKNAFTYEDGTICQDEIKFELNEFYNVSDCIKANLSTMHSGEMLRSGGMIKIEAFAGNKKLKLANDASLSIIFTTQKNGLEEGMQIFYGEINDNAINWKTEGSEADIQGSGVSIDYKRSLIALSIYDEIVYFNSAGKEVYYEDEEEKQTLDSLNLLKQSASAEELVEINNKIQKFSEDQTKRRTEFMDMQRKQQLNLTLENGLKSMNLGWINCDAFTRKQNLIDMYVDLENAKDYKFYLYFEDMKSVMSGYMAGPNSAQFFKIPQNKKAKLICYQYGKDLNKFEMKEITTAGTRVTVSPKAMTKEEIDMALMVLNKPL